MPKQSLEQLLAFILILKHTSGYLPVCTDSKYVFDGFSKGPKQQCSTNKDLWAKLWRTYKARNGICKLDWTPSHKDEGSLVTGEVLPWHWLANYLADRLASTTALEFDLHRDHVLQHAELYDRAASVRRRLVAVHETWFSLKESQFLFHRDTALLQERELKRARVDVDRAALDDPHSQVSALLSASRHNVNRTTKQWTCVTCWTSTDSRTSGLIPWLRGICIHVKPPWVDRSHVYRYEAPWHFCLKCGSHFSDEGPLRYRNLAGPCSRPYQTSWLIAMGFLKSPSKL